MPVTWTGSKAEGGDGRDCMGGAAVAATLPILATVPSQQFITGE